MFVAYRDVRNLAILMQGHEHYTEIAERLRAPLKRMLDWYLYSLPPDGVVPAPREPARLPGEPLEPANGRVVAGVDSARLHHLDEEADEQFLPPVHAEGEGLDDQDIPVPVDDQPGKVISFTVHKPAGARRGGGRAEARAQRYGGFEAITKEPFIDLALLGGEQAHRDHRARVEQPHSEGPAGRGAHHHGLSVLGRAVEPGDLGPVDP